ncbi:MAG: serine hydrolase domain-containing protein [Caldimicrobium sp.]
MLKILSLHELLKKGVREGVFPGAVLGILYKRSTYLLSAGYSSLTPFLEPMEEGLIFDLASLTKPLATGLILIKLLQEGMDLDLEKPLGYYISAKEPLSQIPLFRFLNHTSGLKAWYPFYKEGPLHLEKIYEMIQNLPLEYSPGSRCLYSDLNFFLITYFLEKLTGASFEKLFEEAKKKLFFTKKEVLLFNPLKKGVDQERIVPTSYDPERKKILRGIVEDENTRALGGVSGVAGLFGNIYGVLKVLESFLSAYLGESAAFKRDIIRYFFEFKDSVSDFALIFMRQSFSSYSATGGSLSPSSIGHLGYTGCSFFIDLERHLIIILLSNRVHPQRGNELIKEFRPLLHRKIIEMLEGRVRGDESIIKCR